MFGVVRDLPEVGGEQVVQQVRKASVRHLDRDSAFTQRAEVGAAEARWLREVESARGEAAVVEVEVIARTVEEGFQRLLADLRLERRRVRGSRARR